MSSSIPISSSSSCVPRARQLSPLGLDLNHACEATSTEVCCTRAHSIFASSSIFSSQTCILQLSWVDTLDLVSDTEDEGSDYGDDSDSDAQYIYVFDDVDSSLYSPSLPSSSSLPPFRDFSFPCDAVSQEDPLFVMAPGDVFADDLYFECFTWKHDELYVVTEDTLEAIDHCQYLEWGSTGVDGSIPMDQIKSAPVVLETRSDICRISSHPIFPDS